MAEDVDATLRESEATIAKSEALLKQAADLLAQNDKLLADNNVSADGLQTFIGQQNQQGQAEYAKEVQAIHEEIERDLPKQQEAQRTARVRPTRQMV
ncbi:MAG: hypothetical protein WDN25_15200 [Acetobacteraceae bacterium]